MNADLNDGMLLEAVRKTQDAHPIEERLGEDKESFIRECLEQDRIPGWGLRAGETVESRMEKARHSRRDFWVWDCLHDTIGRVANWRDKTPQELFWNFWETVIEGATEDADDTLDFVLQTGDSPQKDPFLPDYEDGYSFTSYNPYCAILSADFNFESLRKLGIDFDFQSYLFPLIRIFHAFDHENLLAEMPERTDSLITFHEAGKELKWVWWFAECNLAHWLKFLVHRIQKNFAMNFGFELAVLYRGAEKPLTFSQAKELLSGTEIRLGNKIEAEGNAGRKCTIETGDTVANLVMDWRRKAFQEAVSTLEELKETEPDSFMLEVMLAGVKEKFRRGWQTHLANRSGKHKQAIQRKHQQAREKYYFYKSLEDGRDVDPNGIPKAEGRKGGGGVDAEGEDGEEA